MSDVEIAADAGPVPAAKGGKGAAVAAVETPVVEAVDATKGGKKDTAASLATGGEVVVPAAPPTWPDDWREQMAKERAGDDAKAYDKELKRLKQLTSPGAVWAKAAELESKFGAGGLLKMPGPKASDEEKSAFNKAMGIPESPDGYLDKIKLANNRVLGDADKPVIESFAKAVHPAGATPAVVNAATDWWFNFQQEQADRQAEADDTFMRQAEIDLRKEWGGSYKATTSAIATMLADAPPEVRDYFAGGRAGDGRKTGNDPAMLKWLGGLALELYPAAANYGDGGGAGSDRLTEIRKIARGEVAGQTLTPALEAEQTALIEAQQKTQRRSNRAA